MRRLVPAELRCIDFRHGDGKSSSLPTAFALTLTSGLAAAASPLPWLAVLAPALGGGAWYAMELLHRRDPDRHPLLRAAGITLTPWGAVERGPIPWPDITGFLHVTVRRDRKSSPPDAWSVVYLDTGGERLQAQRDEDPFLEVLGDLIPGFAFDAAMPAALDLEEEGRSTPAGPSAFEEILSAARHLLADGRRTGLTSTAAADYRHADTIAAPETVGRLRSALLDAPSIADRAPLAAVLAAELGLASLDQDLCSLVMSPHPLVAATCKAAALKLGVSAVRAGAISEVSPFLEATEIRALEAWAERRA